MYNKYDIRKKFKKTNKKKYQEIRRFLMFLLGPPDFIDNIINGVSFKYYINRNLQDNISEEFGKNLKENILKSVPNDWNVEVKILRRRSSDSNDILEHYHYWRAFDSLRILVRE